MLKQRKLMVFLMVMGVLGIQAVVQGGEFKHGSEPHGFRGIEWGRDISSLKDMRYLRTENISPDLFQKLYARKNDVLKIGTAQVKSIDYYFWKGKLYSVQINVYGRKNYNKLKDYCFKRFGKLTLDPIIGYNADWSGNITTAKLGYNPVLKHGSLNLTSVIIQSDVWYNLRNPQW